MQAHQGEVNLFMKSNGGQKTILVVDDNSDVRRLVRKVLKRAGYNIIEAATGEEAMKVVEKIIPALVLMDIRLPGAFDGLTTTRRMKEDPRLNCVPIIALTASVMAADRERSLAAGCSGFIEKPIDITALPSQVERFLIYGAGAAPR